MTSPETDQAAGESDPHRTLREIEWRSPELVCPECETLTISVLLRLDPNGRDWQHLGTCSACGRQFDPKLLRTFGERLDELARQVEGESCRNCHGRHRGIRAFCDRKARRCFFLIACEECGDVRLA